MASETSVASPLHRTNRVSGVAHDCRSIAEVVGGCDLCSICLSPLQKRAPGTQQHLSDLQDIDALCHDLDVSVSLSTRFAEVAGPCSAPSNSSGGSTSPRPVNCSVDCGSSSSAPLLISSHDKENLSNAPESSGSNCSSGIIKTQCQVRSAVPQWQS